MRVFVVVPFLLIACSDEGVSVVDAGPIIIPDSGQLPPVADSGPAFVDLDEDGFGQGQGDCDDNNPNIHPDAEEVCDGVDNNCNNEIDEGVLPRWYLDSDGDSFGNPSLLVSIEACQRPAGFVDNPDDCDDAAPMINPNAQELCDGINNDCDGEIDEDVGNFTCSGCMDPGAPNYDEDATVPCADCCGQAPEPCDGTSGRQVEICMTDIDHQSGQFNVRMVNEVAVGGFQFDLEGATFSSVCCGSSEEQGLTVQHSPTRILGFSLSGGKITPGDERLIRIGFSPSDANPCLVGAVMADQFGAQLSVSVHCEEGP
jgi:hypothetical protein